MYVPIPPASKVFPCFRPTCRKTSENCLPPVSSTIPKISDSAARCQRLSEIRPGANGPLLWWQNLSMNRMQLLALRWS